MSTLRSQGHHHFKWLLGCAVVSGTLFGMGLHYFSDRPQQYLTARAPSADAIWGHSVMGKHQRNFNLRIVEDATEENRLVRLTLYIQPTAKNFSGNIRIQWLLPDTVRLQSGETYETFESIQGQPTLESSIVVENFTESELQTIIAQVVSQTNGIDSPTEAATIASRPTRAQQVIEHMRLQEESQ